MKIFGFNNFSEDRFNVIEENYPVQNILNVLGWFPLLGTVIGSVRIGNMIIVSIADEKSGKRSHTKYYILSVTRGVVEIFSFGFVFVIPDVIASITRNRELKKKNTEKIII